MKKIILTKASSSVICIEDVSICTPIFAKNKGKLAGMVVKEVKGWILRTGGEFGAYGHCESLKRLIEIGAKYGYTFFIEE